MIMFKVCDTWRERREKQVPNNLGQTQDTFRCRRLWAETARAREREMGQRRMRSSVGRRRRRDLMWILLEN